MSTRKTTFFYALLIAVSSLAVGMVIASRFDLTPMSSAQTLTAPAMNSAPVTGPLDAQTFRNVAKARRRRAAGRDEEARARARGRAIRAAGLRARRSRRPSPQERASSSAARMA